MTAYTRWRHRGRLQLKSLTAAADTTPVGAGRGGVIFTLTAAAATSGQETPEKGFES